MNHLDGHPHAFLDNNNIVIAINIFDGHDNNLLETVKQFHNAVDIKCCCDNGFAYAGGDFYNNKFYPPKPYLSWVRDEDQGIWIAPTPYPTDSEQYTWDENTLSWLLLPPSN